MPNLVGLHSTPDLRPVLRLKVQEPARLDELHATLHGIGLTIHSYASSALGPADVGFGGNPYIHRILYPDANPVSLEVLGPTSLGAPRVETYSKAAENHYHDHSDFVAHTDWTWDWPIGEDRDRIQPREGNDTFVVRIHDLDGNVVAERSIYVDFGRAAGEGCAYTYSAYPEHVPPTETCSEIPAWNWPTVAEDEKGLAGLGGLPVVAALVACALVLRRRLA
jgi:hypothetical protein